MVGVAWLHVAAAVALLGPAAWTPALVRAARRDPGLLGAARFAARLGLAGYLAVGALGVWLVLAGDEGEFGDLWVDGAGFLTFAGLVLTTAGVLPALRRERLREAFVASAVADFFLALALYLMVFRPV